MDHNNNRYVLILPFVGYFIAFRRTSLYLQRGFLTDDSFFLFEFPREVRQNNLTMLGTWNRHILFQGVRVCHSCHQILNDKAQLSVLS